MKKAIVKTAFASLAVAASLFSAQAIGGIAYGYELDYYSDATMTERVGGFTFSCSNKRIYEGTRTAYVREVARWSCASGGGL